MYRRLLRQAGPVRPPSDVRYYGPINTSPHRQANRCRDGETRHSTTSASTDAALAHRLAYSRPLEFPETLQHANCRNNEPLLPAGIQLCNVGQNLLCCSSLNQTVSPGEEPWFRPASRGGACILLGSGRLWFCCTVFSWLFLYPLPVPSWSCKLTLVCRCVIHNIGTASLRREKSTLAFPQLRWALMERETHGAVPQTKLRRSYYRTMCMCVVCRVLCVVFDRMAMSEPFVSQSVYTLPLLVRSLFFSPT